MSSGDEPNDGHAPTLDADPDSQASATTGHAPTVDSADDAGDPDWPETAATADTVDGDATDASRDPFLPTQDSADDGRVGRVTLEAQGRYVIKDVLGRGGQSLVQLAHDGHLRRDVAFKSLLKAGVGEGRFVREARLTARLDHPGIVGLHELGRRQSGHLYATQTLIRGDTLGTRLARAGTLDDRLVLVRNLIDACYAVGFAHDRGIVHRDLKPENIMIGAFGETVVLDWGIARDAAEPDDDDAFAADLPQPGETAHGAILGTPGYMSPEQAQGDQARVDARSDVWSLGAILYEIVCGQPALSGGTLDRLQRTVDGEIPPLQQVAKGAPPDLVAIADRAMDPDPEVRFHDAAELAEELEAWRDGRRVSVYDYASWELLWRWLGRHKLAASFAVVLVAVLAVNSAMLRAERDRVVASEAIVLEEQALVHVTRGDALLEAQRYGEALGAYERAEAASPLPAASFGAALAARLALSVDEVAQGPPDARALHASWDLATCVGVGQQRALSTWTCGSDAPRRRLGVRVAWGQPTALSGDGRRVAVADAQSVRVLDVATGEEVARQTVRGVSALALDEDGAWLGFVADGRASVAPVLSDGKPRQLGAAGDAIVLAPGQPPAVYRAAVGVPVAAATPVVQHPSGALTLATAGGGTVRFGHHPAAVRAAAVEHGLIAVGDEHGEVRVWDRPLRRSLARFDVGEAVVGLDLLGDRSTLRVLGRTGAAWSVDLNPVLQARARGERGVPVEDVKWPPEGAPRPLAEAVRDATALTWSPAAGDGTPRALLVGTEGGAFLTRGGQRTPAGPRERVVDLAWGSPERAHVLYRRALTSLDQTGKLATRTELDGWHSAIAATPSRVYVARGRGPVIVLDAANLERTGTLDGAERVRRLALSPDGQLLAGVGRGTGLLVWRTDAGTLRRGATVDDAADVAFGPDGRWLVTVSADRAVRLWSTDTLELVFTWRSEGFRAFTAVDVAPDGRSLVLGDALGGTAEVPWPVSVLLGAM